MKSDYLYPAVADRQPPGDWQQAGARDMRERARLVARDVLQTHFPEYIDSAHERWIRERYDILLPASAMRPA